MASEEPLMMPRPDERQARTAAKKSGLLKAPPQQAAFAAQNLEDMLIYDTDRYRTVILSGIYDTDRYCTVILSGIYDTDRYCTVILSGIYDTDRYPVPYGHPERHLRH